MKLTGMNLTVEQVRRAIFIGDVWDEYTRTHYISRTDMQTIADELNATLGGDGSIIEWKPLVMLKTSTRDLIELMQVEEKLLLEFYERIEKELSEGE